MICEKITIIILAILSLDIRNAHTHVDIDVVCVDIDVVCVWILMLCVYGY